MTIFKISIIVLANLIWLAENQAWAVSGTNPSDQTMDLKGQSILKGEQLINEGLILTGPQGLYGILENHGNIMWSGTTSCREGQIINGEDGTIIFSDYIDCYGIDIPSWYPPQLQTAPGLIDNAGTILVAKVKNTDNYWTAYFRGAIINQSTGKFLVRVNNEQGNLVGGTSSAAPRIENSGYFEIGSENIWDINGDSSRYAAGGEYLQDSGELHVDGIFGAKTLGITGGKISGGGTVQGYFAGDTISNATFSPGSPVGTLTINPYNSSYNYATTCSRCLVDIELSDEDTYDQLHVLGEFTMSGPTYIVGLRDGYDPAVGTRFTILSADSINHTGLSPVYNLPELTGGKTWEREITSSEVILTVVAPQ